MQIKAGLFTRSAIPGNQALNEFPVGKEKSRPPFPAYVEPPEVFRKHADEPAITRQQRAAAVAMPQGQVGINQVH